MAAIALKIANALRPTVLLMHAHQFQAPSAVIALSVRIVILKFVCPINVNQLAINKQPLTKTNAVVQEIMIASLDSAQIIYVFLHQTF